MAPAPPSCGRAVVKASTMRESALRASHDTSFSFNTGVRSLELCPRPWTTSTQRRPARRESTRNRSTAGRASLAVIPCRSRCACQANSPRRSCRATRGSSPLTTPSTYSRVSVTSKSTSPATSSARAASPSASSLSGGRGSLAGAACSTRWRCWAGSGTTPSMARASRSCSSSGPAAAGGVSTRVGAAVGFGAGGAARMMRASAENGRLSAGASASREGFRSRPERARRMPRS
jgi:hypothetical protein